MPRSSRIFRLFVSSTFTDLQHERRALQEHVFPRLKKLCEQYGTKFQAIDLRWGVSTEAQLDHRTLDICINELRRCKELSPKPNFLILLGNRYGWRPVPNLIEKREFELILEQIKKTNESSYALLQKWYREDRNQVPVSYRLVPRTGTFEAHEVWEPVELQLRAIFDEVVEVLPFSPEQKGKYLLSATEHEIREGAFAQEDAADHVFAYFRDLNGVPESPQAQDYLDFTPSGEIDEADRKRLAMLKRDVEDFLPAKNILRQRVDWKEDDLDVSYLPDFYEDILTKLEAVIKRECEEILELSFSEKEKETHQQFSKNHSQQFIGRDEQFAEVKGKIESSVNPIVVCGESGVGKTAFAAALADQLKREVPSAQIVQRFIGASSFGMNTFELMQSILAELNPERTKEILAKKELDELEGEMSAAFLMATAERPFMIVVDAIDQLQDNGSILSVLFSRELPKHVTIIVTVAEDSILYPSLQGSLSKPHLVTIEKMSITEGRLLLQQWLKRESRTLQPEQEGLVLKAFKESPLPLYLKLAFEEVKMWTSYQEDKTLMPSISGILEQFFERLSDPSHHGEILIKNVFGLLSASRNGLQESELLDLLSTNTEVMDDFHSHAKHESVGADLPVVFWARLFNDLEPYLMERNENGSHLYNFYHRQIGTKIKQTFLKETFHKDIVTYFGDQPSFVDGESMRIVNMRKAVELPYQLFKSGSHQSLESLLTDFHFLQAKLQAKLSHDLLQDYENLQELQTKVADVGTNTEDFARFCRIRHVLLVQYPEQILSIALRMPEASAVFKKASSWYKKKNIPYFTTSEEVTIHNRFLHAFQLSEDKPAICLWHPDGTHLLTVHEGSIKVWDIHTGAETGQIQPRIGGIENAVFSEQGDLLAVSSKQTLKVLQLSDSQTIYEKGTKEPIKKLAWSQQADVVAVGTEQGFIELHDLSSKEPVIIQPVKDAILQLAWRPDGEELAIWYSDNNWLGIHNMKIALWNVQKQKMRKWLRSRIQLRLSSSAYYELHYNDSGTHLWTSEELSIMRWDLEQGIRDDSTVNLAKGRHYFYGPYVISVLNKKEIRVWEKETGNEFVQMKQLLADTFHTVAFKDGMVAAITEEGKTSIWDLRQIDSSGQTSPSVLWAYDHTLWVFSHYTEWVKKLLSNFTLMNLKNQFNRSIDDLLENTGDTFQSIVVSSSLSPKGNYLATGHMGEYLQIHNRANDEMIRYLPFKSGTVQFCDWSHDEKVIAFGTRQFVWIMNIKNGHIKRTLTSENEIAAVCWSPDQNVICIVHSSGMIDLLNVTTDSGKRWSFDLTGADEAQIIAKWSPDGQYLSLCAGELFYVYHVAVSKELIQETLVGKGKLNQQTVNFEWSPDSKQIAFLSDHFEVIVFDVQRKNVTSQLSCFSQEPTETLSSYLENYMVQPNKKILQLETYAEKENWKSNVSNVERLAHVSGATALLSWNESGSQLAVGLGSWLKVFFMEVEKETDLLYVDEPINYMFYREGNLQTIGGNNLTGKKYVLTI